MKARHLTKILVGVLGMVGVVTLTISNSAYARINEDIVLKDGGVGIAISPARTQFDISPGSTTTGKMRVRGTGQDTNLVFAQLSPFSVENYTYQQNFNNTTQRNEILRWSSLELSECDEVPMSDSSKTKIYFELRPQEECFVDYIISTPANAPGGSQHMALFVQSYVENTIDSGSAGIVSSHRIGMTMFASNRDGKVDEQGRLIKQDIPFWVFSGPLKTAMTIENSGNIDFNATVEIETKNLFGNIVYKSEKPKEVIVMAGTIRTTSSDWDSAGIGIYQTTQTVRFLGEEHVKTKWSFLIPLWLLIAILIALSIFVLSVVYGFRKKSSKSKKMRNFK